MNVFNSAVELFEKFKPTPLLKLSLSDERGDVFCQTGIL
ncbi:hypothetical protein OCC_03582 [Thermococcus litoralis DSM 5473]|uniref:Uncharacterized protein n=1 Tax=Thermococcus litoralis (strain ATCC 51850 / DSM 5473 / JCM 8560 / NS-C) TaxID=523849 RepID=H3ZP71_THELN|nr:hypothetical protein OCC_03582 [Thermococcus litoralis DSM 5473]